MGLVLDALNDNLADFVARQPVFFVGTAPTDDDGHVNVSPKGLAGTFAVLGPTSVAYLDLGGSGIETTAHLRQNGRITLMFCSFDAKPLIVRLYGRGETLPAGTDGFEALRPHFGDDVAVARAVIRVAVDRVSTSCGYAVPRMEFRSDRPTLQQSLGRKSADQLAHSWTTANRESIDGLPGLDVEHAHAVAAVDAQRAAHAAKAGQAAEPAGGAEMGRAPQAAEPAGGAGAVAGRS